MQYGGMEYGMRPDAIEQEREAMARNALEVLAGRGIGDFRVELVEGYENPEPVTVPVLDVPMTADIHAQDDSQAPILAVVEPSTDLGEALCGRRWQALHAWLEQHGGQLLVFVHPEDAERAREIARHWHLDPSLVEPLPRRH